MDNKDRLQFTILVCIVACCAVAMMVHAKPEPRTQIDDVEMLLEKSNARMHQMKHVSEQVDSVTNTEIVQMKTSIKQLKSENQNLSEEKNQLYVALEVTRNDLYYAKSKVDDDDPSVLAMPYRMESIEVPDTVRNQK